MIWVHRDHHDEKIARRPSPHSMSSAISDFMHSPLRSRVTPARGSYTYILASLVLIGTSWSIEVAPFADCTLKRSHTQSVPTRIFQPKCCCDWADLLYSSTLHGCVWWACDPLLRSNLYGRHQPVGYGLPSLRHAPLGTICSVTIRGFSVPLASAPTWCPQLQQHRNFHAIVIYKFVWSHISWVKAHHSDGPDGPTVRQT